ncbi:hypothetical protein OPQ81_007262 [Rhizoctonia solani]|nr:hypothetical protein OPQ81_007262 [Rhizoctonia solani]
MNDTCHIQMDGGILDIGSRCAIYGTALLALGLGCLSMVNVSRAITAKPATTPRTARIAEDEMYKNIRSHKKTIRPVSTTLNLMGVAMVGTAFIYQSKSVQERAAETVKQNPDDDPRTNMGIQCYPSSVRSQSRQKAVYQLHLEWYALVSSSSGNVGSIWALCLLKSPRVPPAPLQHPSLQR